MADAAAHGEATGDEHTPRAFLARAFEPTIVAVFSALYFAFAYHVAEPTPRTGNAGWTGWHDQSQYYVIVKILATGHLPVGADTFTYGLGYPITAVVPYLLGALTDSFIIPSIILTSLALAFVLIAARRLIGRAGAWVVVTLLMLASPLLPATVEPWNTTITVFCFAAALAIGTMKHLAWPWYIVLGLLAAWTYSARFVDIIAILAVAVVAIFRERRGRWWLGLTVGVATLAACGVLLGWIQWKALGSVFTTPYLSHTRLNGATNDQSWAEYPLSNIPLHFKSEFFTAFSSGRRQPNVSPLLLVSPYLVLAPVGFVLAVIRDRGRRLFHIAVAVATIALGLFYLAFVAGGGDDLIYGNQRYYLPWYFYWTILAVYAAQRLLALIPSRRLVRSGTP